MDKHSPHTHIHTRTPFRGRLVCSMCDAYDDDDFEIRQIYELM